MSLKAVSLFSAFVLAFVLSACSPPPPDPDQPSSGVPVEVKGQEDSEDNSGRVTTASLLRRMASTASCAILDPSETVRFSSSNTPGAMSDADTFQERFNADGREWKVLFDQQGPGCVTRLWLSEEATGNLRIYFDNEESPRIDAPINEFFSEEFEPFTTLFVYDNEQSANGYVCMFPMPFAERCRIAIDSTGTGIQYQVQSLQWEDGREVETFSLELSPSAVRAKNELFTFLSSLATQKYGDLSQNSVSVTIPANGFVTVANLRGPAALEYLQFSFESYSTEMLNNLRLEIYWDSIVEPAVDCTVAEFFNMVDIESGWSVPSFGGSPQSGVLYTQIYMPFQSKAQILLTSTNDQPVTVSASYRTHIDEVPDDAMYFFAKSKRIDALLGLIYPVFEFEGQGRYMGFSYKSITAEAEPRHFVLDGDDYFYIDGEEQPTIAGTGLDNAINGANRLEGISRYWMPTHGCWIKDDLDGGRSYGFRYRYLDSVPFNSSLMRVQELGCPVTVAQTDISASIETRIEWVNYWYGLPKPSAERQEELYYFGVSQNKDQAPSKDSPVIIGDQLFIKLNPGEWWLHLSPVWDLSQVQQIRHIVPPAGSE